MKTKLEHSDILEMQAALAPTKEQIQQAAERLNLVKSKVIALVLKNVATLKLTVITEDDCYDATIKELENAVATASERDLRSFLKSRQLPFEDGYIQVKF